VVADDLTSTKSATSGRAMGQGLWPNPGANIPDLSHRFELRMYSSYEKYLSTESLLGTTECLRSARRHLTTRSQFTTLSEPSRDAAKSPRKSANFGHNIWIFRRISSIWDKVVSEVVISRTTVHRPSRHFECFTLSGLGLGFRHLS